MITPDDYYHRHGVGPYPQTPADDRDEIHVDEPLPWPWFRVPLLAALLIWAVIELVTR